MSQRLVIALLAGALAGHTVAQPAHTGPMAGGMATRSVSQYLALERRLQDALTHQDTATVGAMLADDFGERTPASPDLIERDAWLKSATRASTFRVRDLVTREEGDVTMVSFLLDSGTGKSRHTQFVVDLWRGEKLLTRLIAPAPGAPPPPSRPDGRE